jgi:hypothetical protein
LPIADNASIDATQAGVDAWPGVVAGVLELGAGGVELVPVLGVELVPVLGAGSVLPARVRVAWFVPAPELPQAPSAKPAISAASAAYRARTGRIR